MATLFQRQLFDAGFNFVKINFAVTHSINTENAQAQKLSVLVWLLFPPKKKKNYANNNRIIIIFIIIINNNNNNRMADMTKMTSSKTTKAILHI